MAFRFRAVQSDRPSGSRGQGKHRQKFWGPWGMAGVDEVAGSALLAGIAAVGDSYAAAQSGQSLAASWARAAKLEVMASWLSLSFTCFLFFCCDVFAETSKLGSAALEATALGRGTRLQALSKGRGLATWPLFNST